jgi:Mg-chelatase subunit ChlD
MAGLPESCFGDVAPTAQIVSQTIRIDQSMSVSFVYPQFLWLLLLVPVLICIGWLGRMRMSRGRFWLSLGVRAIISIFLVLALAGIQLRLKSDVLTTVFVVDASDSIPLPDQVSAKGFIQQSLDSMAGNDQAAIIVFGEDALVERLASDLKDLAPISSVPVTTRTDIANALQLAQAIFPGEGAKRIVLLSDGRENLGAAIDQAELAAASNIQLLYVPLGGEQGSVEVWLDKLDAPAEIRQGQEFELKATVKTTKPVDATIRVFENDVLIQSLEERLRTETSEFSIPIQAKSAEQPGNSFRRYRVQVIPSEDTRLQNNEASAFTIVHGPPNVLVVEGKPGYGDILSEALSKAEMQLSRTSPQAMPTTLAELANYDSIILVDVPAGDLPTGMLEILPVFVRDLGKGLLVVGGPQSYGAGGYLRTPLEKALPVDMDVRDKDVQSNLALVLAVDKSGSMGRCHCDNPDLNQSYTPRESGQAKVDIAKEAIMRAAGAIGDQDYLGVVAFDSQPRWVLDLKPLVDPLTLEKAIGSFQAEGQTNMQAGVQAAYEALENVQAKRKQIILMTDGWVRQGDLTPLALAMQKEGITLSIVAAGEGAGAYLNALARTGGGTFYPARSIQDVPDIFLKETIKSVGKYVIEEPFYPLPAAPSSSVLRGLDPSKLPPLLGYNGTSSKNTARLELITPRGDPLLATWQFGLGRAAAWMSDLKGQWASRWLSWEGFPRFVTQLVAWTLPAPRIEGLTASAKLIDNQAVIQVQAVKQDGSPFNFLTGAATIIDPQLKKKELALKQTGAGQYQASEDVSEPGVYLVRVGVNDRDQSLGQITLGLVVPYSPEYRFNGRDQGLLNQLARLTKGGKVTDPANSFNPEYPDQSGRLKFTDNAHEIWLPLLLAAALLFPFDVAVRRLTVKRKDLNRAYAWVKSKLKVKPLSPASQPRLLGGLFDARQRARRRSVSSAEPGQPVSLEKLPTPSQKEDRSHPEARPEAQPALNKEIDSIARLRQAKKRAKR